ncbi:MAG: hypothetical protein JG776_491 [Caloramator sp.]|jgi:hypothetical protein|uniref:hypothetical protein n=1 Tax=unclassified Caloramator TaxID=2629145 RepID=UPI000552A2B2|nr:MULTISPECIES: hypothetical protein [unclassified Caloramator]MBZ4662809.1 hypothetical protein [Caloramator sp.]
MKVQTVEKLNVNKKTEEVRGMNEKMEGNRINILSELYTRLIVETDEENPVTIAEITENDAIPAVGYRIRLKPKYD